MTVDEAKERLASVRHSWSKAGVFMEGFKYTPAQEIVRADIQALDTLLNAYEAREADRKRLDWLESEYPQFSRVTIDQEMQECPQGGVCGLSPDVCKCAALSGTENATPND